jgi:hypothetical protein
MKTRQRINASECSLRPLIHPCGADVIWKLVYIVCCIAAVFAIYTHKHMKIVESSRQRINASKCLLRPLIHPCGANVLWKLLYMVFCSCFCHVCSQAYENMESSRIALYQWFPATGVVPFSLIFHRGGPVWNMTQFCSEAAPNTFAKAKRTPASKLASVIKETKHPKNASTNTYDVLLREASAYKLPSTTVPSLRH